MKITELEVKESFDGELYFRLPDDLLDRLGWEVGDDLKFIPQDDAFIIKKVKYETIELDFNDEELLKYMMFAHERNISFNELVEEALVNAIPSIEKVVKKRKLHDE
jgi:bifunctional DNA-binding transcriptional regulator/antitoxin component of YhaV-PrlF toxin-antitoxin module